jgi:formamidopyrimidine-DNA glycosylase
MPELPEVEVTRRALLPYAVGHKIRSVIVREHRLRWPIPGDLPDVLSEREVVELQRRGKYLLWRFEHGTLLSHLGMSGAWRIHVGGAPPPGVHDHVDVVVSGSYSAVLRLTDPRRFGALLWHPASMGDVAQHALLHNLGPEPFDPQFNAEHMHRFTRGKSAAIKQVLLAGDLVVGVGNIYASESLFRAGIDPRRAASRLTRAQCARLVTEVQAVLHEAIAVGGSTLRDFVGADGAKGYFMLDAFVYGREGQACRICGNAIRRIVQGARATYFCPHCQGRQPGSRLR